MKGTTLTKTLRVFFGMFMVCVYLAMAVALAVNFFDWSNTPMWKAARWAMAVVFGLYGCYRCYRQVKGVDYYHHDRDYYDNEEAPDGNGNNTAATAIALLMLALATTACNNTPATNSSTMGIAKINCDESFRNILDQEIEVFEYTYPEASIMPRYMDEAAALDSLLHKHCDLIVTARDLTDEQRDILDKQGRAHRSRKIAVDAVAIIVNNSNDIAELSMQDLSDIFTGKVKRWGEVFPTSLKRDSIVVVFDDSGSGVMHYVKEKFLNGGKFGDNVFAQRSTEEVFKTVEGRKGAIGFVGVSWISANMQGQERTIEDKVTELRDKNEVSVISFTDRIKVMPIRGAESTRGYKPYQAYINDGSYPLVRTIWAIDASAGGTLDHGFYAFLTGVIGQKIILQTGILPAAEPVRYVETTK